MRLAAGTIIAATLKVTHNMSQAANGVIMRNDHSVDCFAALVSDCFSAECLKAGLPSAHFILAASAQGFAFQSLAEFGQTHP